MYVFDIHYRKIYSTTQTLEIHIRFTDGVDAGRYVSYALILTKNFLNSTD